MAGPKQQPDPESSLESTSTLIERVRSGDLEARERLVARYLPTLRRWAHGRLPATARDLADTDDLVQVALIRALGRLEGFEPRREGAFLAYLRQILVNQIRDEIRRTRRRPSRDTLDDELPAANPSPLETAIGSETMERYEHALMRLSFDHREAVILRVELGYTYQQIAEALERPTANAARLLVSRALVHLARLMNERR